MYHCLTMHVYQPISDTFELSEGIVRDGCDQWKQDLTSSNLFTPLCALTNSLIFPFAIHSDTIANRGLPIVAPNSGSIFGWRRAFHVTTSLQNIYTGQHQLAAQTSSKTVTTHTRDLTKVAPRANPQYLDRNVATLVSALPHIGAPAVIQRVIRSIVTGWDLQ